jgi:hypothetical protein
MTMSKAQQQQQQMVNLQLIGTNTRKQSTQMCGRRINSKGTA